VRRPPSGLAGHHLAGGALTPQPDQRQTDGYGQSARDRNSGIAKSAADHRTAKGRADGIAEVEGPILMDEASPGASCATCITRICTGGTMAKAAAPQTSRVMAAPTGLPSSSGEAIITSESAARKIAVKRPIGIGADQQPGGGDRDISSPRRSPAAGLPRPHGAKTTKLSGGRPELMPSPLPQGGEPITADECALSGPTRSNYPAARPTVRSPR